MRTEVEKLEAAEERLKWLSGVAAGGLVLGFSGPLFTEVEGAIPEGLATVAAVSGVIGASWGFWSWIRISTDDKRLPFALARAKTTTYAVATEILSIGGLVAMNAL